MKRHLPKLLAALLTFLIGICSAGNFPYESGRLQAYVDVARGRYELQVFGTIDRELAEFSKIAANEYGIEVYTHGCIISDQGIERVRGYNEVSEAAIKRKYGVHVIDSIWDQARARYRAKQLAP